MSGVSGVVVRVCVHVGMGRLESVAQLWHWELQNIIVHHCMDLETTVHVQPVHVHLLSKLL